MSVAGAGPETDVAGITELFGDQGKPDDVVVEVRDVSVRFGGINALMGMGFEARHGEIVGVIGPNGAGKTTLLNTICGLSGANMTGEIVLNGRSVTKWRPSAIAAAGLGRSFQHPPLLEHETVADNVVCGMHGLDKYSLASQVFRPRHVARREALLYERALLLLDVVGLSDLADHAVGSLSYGQRKLIDIARAMASGPRLLLLDEPTSGLDFAEQEKVKNILLTLRASGRVTVLVVEHHMDMVRNTATRVLGLQAGAVLAEGDPGQVLDSEAFRQAVVGR